MAAIELTKNIPMKTSILFILSFFTSSFFAQVSITTDPNIIFKESFKDNSNNWPINSTGSSTYIIKDGNYVMENKGEEKTLVAIAVNKPLSDYLIGVNMDHVSGVQNSGYGLFFGGSDTKNGYVFEFSAEGKYRFYRLTNNIEEEIIPWIENRAINKGNSRSNSLKIKIDGKSNIMEFYINDLFLKSFNQYKMLGNKFGFITTKSQRVKFHNLEFQKKDEFLEDLKGIVDAESDGFLSEFDKYDKIFNKTPLKTIDSTNFEGKLSGWSFDDLHTKLNNGKMIITSDKGKKYSATTFIYPKVSVDFAVAIDTKHIAGNLEASYGIMIGYKEKNITFYISANGYFNILQGENQVSKWTKNENIHTGNNAENHLSINKSDSGYEFYVNDKLIYTSSFDEFSRYSTMQVYLMVSHEQTVEFDNLKVSGTYQGPMFVMK